MCGFPLLSLAHDTWEGLLAGVTAGGGVGLTNLVCCDRYIRSTRMGFVTSVLPLVQAWIQDDFSPYNIILYRSPFISLRLEQAIDSCPYLQPGTLSRLKHPSEG